MSEERNIPTPEQIEIYEKARTAQLQHWKLEIPKLKIEAQYNELQARIEKARMEAWHFRMQFETMMARPPVETPEEDKMSVDTTITKDATTTEVSNTIAFEQKKEPVADVTV